MVKDCNFLFFLDELSFCFRTHKNTWAHKISDRCPITPHVAGYYGSMAHSFGSKRFHVGKDISRQKQYTTCRSSFLRKKGKTTCSKTRIKANPASFSSGPTKKRLDQNEGAGDPWFVFLLHCHSFSPPQPRPLP